MQQRAFEGLTKAQNADSVSGMLTGQICGAGFERPGEQTRSPLLAVVSAFSMACKLIQALRTVCDPIQQPPRHTRVRAHAACKDSHSCDTQRHEEDEWHLCDGSSMWTSLKSGYGGAVLS